MGKRREESERFVADSKIVTFGSFDEPPLLHRAHTGKLCVFLPEGLYQHPLIFIKPCLSFLFPSVQFSSCLGSEDLLLYPDEQIPRPSLHIPLSPPPSELVSVHNAGKSSQPFLPPRICPPPSSRAKIAIGSCWTVYN